MCVLYPFDRAPPPSCVRGCARLHRSRHLPSVHCTSRHTFPRAAVLHFHGQYLKVTPLTSVLIVDDEEPIRELLSRWVQSLNLQPCTACNADEAVATLNTRHCDLAIIDIMMPGKNGLWLADELRRTHPDVAVVLSTGNAAMINNSPPPIADLLIKPYKRERFVLAVDRGREWRRQAVEELERQAHLMTEVQMRIADVKREVERARQTGDDESDALWQIAMSRMPDVVEHSERVERYTASIARELEVDRASIDLFERAARFHDIGKLAMPDVVLTKPSPLTRGEVAIMRAHVDAGVAILSATSTLNATVAIVKSSHEWLNGQGYPQGLAGEAIPLASRIISVADAYDAMTQDRRYRTRLDAVEAVSELLRGAPTQFDPDVVVAFLNIVNRH
jgi:cyclic di-GMP phosphodiesterase